MKIAIAGGHGQIALLLARQLTDAGHDAVADAVTEAVPAGSASSMRKARAYWPFGSGPGPASGQV